MKKFLFLVVILFLGCTVDTGRQYRFDKIILSHPNQYAIYVEDKETRQVDVFYTGGPRIITDIPEGESMYYKKVDSMGTLEIHVRNLDDINN